MSKAVGANLLEKKMIVPVSKKLVAAVGMEEKKTYAAYFTDGLLVIAEPLKAFTDSFFERGRETGYDEGFYDGKEEGFFRGYRVGYDDAVEGYGYRDFTDCDCGIDCDYNCRECRFNDKKNKGGH